MINTWGAIQKRSHKPMQNSIQKIKQRVKDRQSLLYHCGKSDERMNNLTVHQKLFRILGALIIFSSKFYRHMADFSNISFIGQIILI